MTDDEPPGERVPVHAAELAARGAGEPGQEPLGGGDGGLAAGGQQSGGAPGPGEQVPHGGLEQGGLAAAGAAEDDDVPRWEHGRQVIGGSVGKANGACARKGADDRSGGRGRVRGGRGGAREAARSEE